MRLHYLLALVPLLWIGACQPLEQEPEETTVVDSGLIPLDSLPTTRATEFDHWLDEPEPVESKPPDAQAEPSTPSPTFTPASSICNIGAIPEAKRIFELGQWATPHPVFE